jgi:hypothetical protein
MKLDPTTDEVKDMQQEFWVLNRLVKLALVYLDFG